MTKYEFVEKPLVSIILTTFNRKEFLAHTIRSVLAQSYTNIEVIVVDNFSNYDFFEFIDSFDDIRLKGFQNENGGVIGINRNFGISKATGMYLAFCDDDDYWVEAKVHSQINLIEEQGLLGQNVLVYTNCINFKDDILEEVKTEKRQVFNINDFALKNEIAFSTVLVTNSPEIQFNEASDFFAVEDFYLWCELMIKDFRFLFLEDALTYYRITNSSASMIGYGVNHLRTMLVLITIKVRYGAVAFDLVPFTLSILKQITKYFTKAIYKYFA